MRITDHRLDEAIRLDSSNWHERPAGVAPSLIVIHGISLPAGHFGGSYIEALFCNRLNLEDHPDFADIDGLYVSSHVLIKRDGAILQFVAFDKCAWHAGESSYGDLTGCNDFSIGIELEGTDSGGYREAQYRALVDVTTLLLETYASLALDRIAGHCDIAPDRKTDPGPSFDWTRFRQSLMERVR